MLVGLDFRARGHHRVREDFQGVASMNLTMFPDLFFFFQVV